MEEPFQTHIHATWLLNVYWEFEILSLIFVFFLIQSYPTINISFALVGSKNLTNKWNSKS